ncbi:IS110 family transposase [Paenibacillus sp. P46E]|uniref:IS110 family transposase n=1 Tax=Paenibacillus sp. P46E TaxID=1349436 RepID=UPI00093F76E3|nr:IS110 family transposase [Paenibacillus sp. P46E]OKP96843.1 transposase [Paenibacillus sp. P46E]
MEAILERCAGLDVHQENVVACILYGELERKPKQEIRTFSTTTKGLLALHDWLNDWECTHVAMESTGVYWKPVWNILEGQFTLILANARRIKNVPGRKTDVADATWIAQLLRSGLITPSFVPPADIRNLRDLTRYRRKLLRDATAEKNRVHKILQDANLKLTTYISDIFGISGRALLESVINGEVLVAEEIRDKVKTSLKRKIPELLEALDGRMRKHHRMMLGLHLDHLTYVENQLATVESEIDLLLEPHLTSVDLLVTIPGIQKDAAAVILAEIGNDMSCFGGDPQIAAWAGLSPGNNESAGKKKSSKIAKGNFYRIQKRRGQKKATIATAHLILRMIYHMLKDSRTYREEGWDYLTSSKSSVDYWVKKIEAQGFIVKVESVETL